MSDRQQEHKQTQTDAAALRKRAEEQTRDMEPTDISAHPPEEIQRMFHELRMHQIELEMQNEELRRAQAEIEAAHARYFELYDLAPVGYVTVSEKGLIMEANLTAATMLGVNRSSLVKNLFAKFIFKEDQEIYYRHRKMLFGGETAHTCELRLEKPDGTTVWMRIDSTAALSEDGESFCRAALSDISEHKQMEAVQSFLARTGGGTAGDSFFQALARYLGQSLGMDFVCIDRLDGDGLNAHTVAVWCDGHFEDNVSYALKDTPCGDVLGKAVCCFPANVCQSFPHDQTLQDLRAESYVGVTLFSHTGQPIGLIAVISRRPLTNKSQAEAILQTVGLRAAAELEQIDAEAAKEKLGAQLRQAQKMESVGRLAGGVAHDFNNMLSVIMGHAEMGMQKVDSEHPLFADLREIRKAAERSASLTRQLLAFARKQIIAPRVIDLNEAVEEMLKMLLRLIGEDIDLLWKPGARLRPVKVDPSQIDQLLANLCVNARDAIKGVGRITIETDTATIDEAYCASHEGFIPGEYVMLAVSDNGCGMDKEILGHLFEPFFTTKEFGKGTGLGLATVYGMVKQNNGFIDVYSELGQGTTFRIYLPQHSEQAHPLPGEAPDRLEEHARATILLVEDEPAILNMITMMLRGFGYTVVAAATPDEAIRLAREFAGSISLLITDVVMPGMNGRDLAGRLLSTYPDLKRLFMSGYTADVIARHGVLDEGVHFIQKPFSRKELADKVRAALTPL